MQQYFCSFNRGDKYLPYYWPKQLSVLSILHFLYFLPLHVKPKASIYSSSLSHITATMKKCNKKYFCDTVLYVNVEGIFLLHYPLLCLDSRAGKNTHLSQNKSKYNQTFSYNAYTLRILYTVELKLL